MSRIGKHSIAIPANVKVELKNGVVSGSSNLGTFSFAVPACLNAVLGNGHLTFSTAEDTKEARAMWGTARAVVAKSIAGLEKLFSKKIDLVGVGYKASVEGKKLVMQLGFSHDVVYDIPADIKITCEKPTTIVVQGADAQRVGQVVRELQVHRKPEPYKGKGLIIQGQYVYRKEGKKK